jgi:hypothetical protein
VFRVLIMLPNSYLSRSDAVVEPVGMWLSSQAYASYRPPDYAPAERELSARRSGRLTFGCFNNFAKIKDQVIELWAEILYAAPGARLLRWPMNSLRWKSKRRTCAGKLIRRRPRPSGYIRTSGRALSD